MLTDGSFVLFYQFFGKLGPNPRHCMASIFLVTQELRYVWPTYPYDSNRECGIGDAEPHEFLRVDCRENFYYPIVSTSSY